MESQPHSATIPPNLVRPKGQFFLTGAEYLKKHCDWLKASPPNPGGKS
jgi:hypothetical protein